MALLHHMHATTEWSFVRSIGYEAVLLLALRIAVATVGAIIHAATASAIPFVNTMANSAGSNWVTSICKALA